MISETIAIQNRRDLERLHRDAAPQILHLAGDSAEVGANEFGDWLILLNELILANHQVGNLAGVWRAHESLDGFDFANHGRSHHRLFPQEKRRHAWDDKEADGQNAHPKLAPNLRGRDFDFATFLA